MIADNTNSFILSEHAVINNIHGKKAFIVGPSGNVADVTAEGKLSVDASDCFNVNDIAEESSTVTYIGMENSEGNWYLKKIDTTSGNSFSHATITNNPSVTTYSSAWSNRATLTYQDFKEAF